MKLRHHAKHLLRGLLIGAILALTIVGLGFGLFVLFFGVHRFLADFWPLDNSRVGPNLCASVAITILIVAHNEWSTAVKAVEKGESIRVMTHDLEVEVIHPTATAEEHIAADVVEQTDR